MDRKKIILYILLGVFAITLTYRVLHPYRQMRASEVAVGKEGAQAPKKKSAAKGAKQSPQTDWIVMIEDFLNPPLHSGETTRDLFSVKKEEALQAAAPAVPASTDPQTPPPSAPEDPSTQVSRDLGGIKVFGSYTRGREKGLFLERGKEILVIHKGDRIDGKYLVKEITEKGLTLRAEFLNEDVHIDLSDF